MTDVKIMVDRFLAWKLPEDFSPDCGINFKSLGKNQEPTGTNLFTASQAEQMVLYMIGGSDDI